MPSSQDYPLQTPASVNLLEIVKSRALPMILPLNVDHRLNLARDPWGCVKRPPPRKTLNGSVLATRPH